MTHKHGIIPSVLRKSILTYLFCQGVFSYIWMMLFLMLSGFDYHSTSPSPDSSWTGFLLWGTIASASILLFRGFSLHAIWGRWRYLFLVSALSNVLVCIAPIKLIHEVGNTSFNAHILYGFPLPLNALILYVVVSKRAYEFLFDTPLVEGKSKSR